MRNRRKTIRLNESTLKRIIKESVRNVLNEMSLHKTNTTRNSDPNGNDCKWNYDGDIIDRWILGIKKDAQKEGGSGPNGFPMAHWFAKNYRRSFKYLHLYTGDIVIAPTTVDYPDYEMSPEELYKSIEELRYANQIGYDDYRQMDYQDRWMFG